jgi:DNA-binding transcriptional MerR regulator
MEPDTKTQVFKVPRKLFRIGDIVQHTPFSRQTIHNYTIMGLIRETEWSRGGHRLYDESVFERLAAIAELKKTCTLTEIRRILYSQDRAGCQQNSGRDDNWKN